MLRHVELGLVLGVTLLSSVARSDSLQLLRPIDDSLVVSEATLVDQNYGADPQLVVWANYPVFGARSYLKFDLSGIPAGEVVTFARLNLFQFNGGGFASGVDVFRVADDSWSEATITWNNQPVLVPADPDLIAWDPALTGYARGWISFDLLANGQWDPSVDFEPGDGQVSVILRITGGEVNTQRAHNLCSSEASGFDCLLLSDVGPYPGRAPQLVIGTPEPQLAAMIGLGAVALALAGSMRDTRPRQCP
jgi:hypothetical protein